MSLAILCSGQGGQHADMFALTGASSAANSIFAHAADLLGEDARALVKNVASGSLHDNRQAQILCTLQATSAMAMLADVLPVERCIAGYSVGEVAAWSAAGLVDACDALDLVALRAQAMDAAFRGEQGMLFVRGLARSVIDDLVGHREAAVAIVNPGDAYVIAGIMEALDAIAVDARLHGASRVTPVGVKVASHTPLMADAVAPFRDRLLQTRIAPRPNPGTRLMSGIDGETVFDVTEGIDKLARQIAQTIHWSDCLRACVEAGATAFLELGPGRALADMAIVTFPGVEARSLDEFSSAHGVQAWLQRVL